MKPLFLIGVVVLVLGILSLFIGIPQRERHGVSAGGVSLGVETKTNEKIPPIASGIMIVAGAGLMIAGRGRS
ncbi:MAG TPA: hypothetical protein VMZ25_06975 [Terriglobales bacterium]|nr:hypothetical protein [Terriglobales bacterium]